MPKILLIEDEQLIREMMFAALQDNGFEVLQAADGEDAVELAKRFCPDLVITDIVMENMDGFAVLEELKKDATTAGIPLVLMSGYLSPTFMRQAMELGASDFLLKPFSSDELLKMVNARLKKTPTS